MKLVQREAESDALREYLRRHRPDERVTSALAHVEVVRAVQSGGAVATATARRQLARVHQVTLDKALLESAATLRPGTLLRSLDAIHLAAAERLGEDLTFVVTYDLRMASAAEAMGLPVAAPA